MTTATMNRRREFHAASAKVVGNRDARRQIFAAYRGKNAAMQEGFEFKPGFIYAQVRAISARINQNFDGWPSAELKKSYRTFIGKPIFVNHQNFDPKLARGKVVAARYVEAGDDKYIETVMEVDANRFPKLAHEIKTGGMDSVSMGVEAGFTICSVCNNKAIDTPDFCDHVRFHKGQLFRTASGENTLVYEKCYKLGFFELSYVFDPADETAVVSRVISAGKDPWRNHGPVGRDDYEEYPDADVPDFGHLEEDPTSETYHLRNEARIDRLANDPPIDPLGGLGGEMSLGDKAKGWADHAEMKVRDKAHDVADVVRGYPTPYHHPPSRWAASDHLAYGEVEAPEDVDTLRDEGEDDDTDDFKHYVESPKELQGPDLDQTKQLDRNQEQQGLDADRNVEDVEDIGGIGLPPHTGYRPKEALAMSRSYLVDPRTGRRYYAADDPDSGGGGQSDEDLIAEAEEDLEKAGDAASADSSDSIDSSDEGGTDDDYSDSDSDDDDSDDDADDDGTPDDQDSDGGSGDLPPWLQDGSDPDSPPTKESRRRRGGKTMSSTQKKRREGAPMSLAQRNRVAAAQRPRNHYADNSGHTDGGPYHLDDNDQGEQEEVFLSQTPSAEAVSAPVPGDGTISNTENNLVARIQRRNAEQQRDIIAYEQITGRRVQSYGAEYGQGPTPALTSADPGHPDHEDPMSVAPMGVNVTGRRRRQAGELGPSHERGLDGKPIDWMEGGDDKEWGEGRRNLLKDPEWGDHVRDNIRQRMEGGTRRRAEAVETPDQVNPELSGTDEQSLKGQDFDSIALDNVETQPKDASVHYFAAFDSWLKDKTGKTATQHGNPVFIRRSAARFCSNKGVDPQVLFPTLGNVLRAARKGEATNRRSNMRRRADESLEVAAPQDRIDVEAPVRDTTDADAQASQFDLGDFGSNAGDNLADPELSPDSQIWAPGEGDSSKTSRRKADGITAVRYAEAYIRAGLAPDSPDQKWRIAGLAQTMRHGTIVDRTRLLDAINEKNAAVARRTAGANRGTQGNVPQGFGQRQLSAGMAHDAANDQSSDYTMWLK